jgi:hypothetical protein
MNIGILENFISDVYSRNSLNVYKENSISGHINLIKNAARKRGLKVRVEKDRMYFLKGKAIIGGLNGMKPLYKRGFILLQNTTKQEWK